MNISENLFARIKKILAAGSDQKNTFLGICKEKFQMDLSESQIVIRNGVVWISASAALKNKIFINKQRILAELQKEKSEIRDISFH